MGFRMLLGRQAVRGHGVVDPGRSFLNGKTLLRAFDKSNGEVIQEYLLPSAPTGTPMTYMANGKQFIAVSLGGGNDAKLVALALP